jgi:hypothetical protein
MDAARYARSCALMRLKLYQRLQNDQDSWTSRGRRSGIGGRRRKVTCKLLYATVSYIYNIRQRHAPSFKSVEVEWMSHLVLRTTPE